MRICSDGHVEIVHDEHNCPLCKSIEREGDLNAKLNKADGVIATLERDLEAAQRED